MPQKKEVTIGEFMTLHDGLNRLKFRRKPKAKGSMPDLIKQLKIAMGFPLGEYKREDGYEFWWKGLTVHVWTSWIEDDGAVRDEDYGWILITNKGKAVYFAKPFMRTENFVPRLLRYAEIIQKKVQNRPLCPKCKEFMDIHSGIGSPTYWFCPHPGKWETMDWDICLTDEEKDFLKIRRKQTKKYNEKRKESGRPKRGTALRSRTKNKNRNAT